MNLTYKTHMTHREPAVYHPAWHDKIIRPSGRARFQLSLPVVVTSLNGSPGTPADCLAMHASFASPLCSVGICNYSERHDGSVHPMTMRVEMPVLPYPKPLLHKLIQSIAPQTISLTTLDEPFASSAKAVQNMQLAASHNRRIGPKLHLCHHACKG